MAGISNIVLGENVPVVLQMSDGNTGLFPQAEIRDQANILLTTLDLVHISSGLYQANYVMPAVDFIAVTYIVYSDAAHTIENTDYRRDCDIFNIVDPDQYKATGFSTSGEYTDILNRILGLNQENQFIDECVYDTGKLISARLRIYSVAGSVGTVNDVIATYTITTTYSGSDMLTYSMVKI